MKRIGRYSTMWTSFSGTRMLQFGKSLIAYQSNVWHSIFFTAILPKFIDDIRGRPRRSLGRSWDCWATLLHRRRLLLLGGRVFSALSCRYLSCRMVWKAQRWVPLSGGRLTHWVAECSGRGLCCPWTWVGMAGTQRKLVLGSCVCHRMRVTAA